jgi:hypothetical protein
VPKPTVFADGVSHVELHEQLLKSGEAVVLVPVVAVA